MAQHIFSGSGAPSFTPTKIGQHYIDVTNGNTYVSAGTSTSSDWKNNSAASPVLSVFGRTGIITAQSGDYNPTQVGLSNVPNVDATNPANIVQTSSYRFTTDAEKSTWNGKQNALGFTPLNSASNLSDIASAPTARTNLGLGTAATQASSAFDAAGTASSAVSAHVALSDPHTQYLLASGARAMAGNLPFGGNKATGAAAATAAGQYVEYAQWQASLGGVRWIAPCICANLVADNLTSPPGSPIASAVYLVGASPTGLWSGLAGRLLSYVSGSWVDVLGRVVAIGDRVGVTIEYGKGSESGNMVGKSNDILTFTNATPGSYAYTTYSPVTSDSFFVNASASLDFGDTYNYTGSAWVEIPQPQALLPGAALAASGNTWNVQVDGTTISVNGSNQLRVPSGIFDTSGAASAAQAFAIQRSNHTGTQSASTITGLSAVATTGAYSDLTGAPSALPPNGSASGDLSGSYPSPTVVNLQARAVDSAAPTTGQSLAWDGTKWTPQTVGGGSGVSVITVSASTLSLTSSSNNYQVFTGTVPGQIVNLPNATTLSVGTDFFLVNETPTIIYIYLNDGTTILGSIYPYHYLECFVSDVSTTNGSWFKESAVPNNPEQSTVFDDFLSSGTTSGSIGQQGWNLVSTNGTASVSYQNATSARLGVARLSTSGNNNSAIAIQLGSTTQVFLGGGIQVFEAYVSIPTLGGTGAAALTAKVGLGDTSNTGDEANGVYFEYTGTSAGTINWSLKTASASTRTTTATSVAVAAGTWYKLSAVINAAGTSVVFYINNAYQATITTNIPTTGLGLAARVISGSTNAAAKSMDIDFYQYMKTFSTVR